ncbi:MAG TPA: patatin-like phospholipase family protein [Blastocatellia bacterium]|jgi:NTE family protein
MKAIAQCSIEVMTHIIEAAFGSRVPSNGRVAIVLSAGYFGFFAHAGFMLAVEELGIDYCAIAGSSAGSVVAAMHASGIPAAEIIELLVSVRRKELWDSTGIGGILQALVKRGRGWTGLLRGQRFEERLNRHLRVNTFEDCRRSLYITALNLTRGIEETFYSGTIADKVRASCSYPFLMSSKAIDGNEYWDGGFLTKIPLETMVEREKPDRLIIHYLPIREEQSSLKERHWSAVALMERALNISRKEIERHRLDALGEIKNRITWVEPVVPRVTPSTLSTGKEAAEAAYRHSKSALSSLF